MQKILCTILIYYIKVFDYMKIKISLQELYIYKTLFKNIYSLKINGLKALSHNFRCIGNCHKGFRVNFMNNVSNSN